MNPRVYYCYHDDEGPSALPKSSFKPKLRRFPNLNKVLLISQTVIFTQTELSEICA